MAKQIPNWRKIINSQIQEAQQTQAQKYAGKKNLYQDTS